MRNFYLDSWKGIAILAVIAIHSFPVVLSDEGLFRVSGSVAFRQIINFPVFIFFGLAGYFVARADLGGKSFDIFERLWRFLPAYLIASLITTLVLRPELMTSIIGWLKILVAGQGIGIGYFVTLLCQFTVLTPLLLRVRSRNIHLVLMLLGTLAGIIFNYVVAPSFSLRFPYTGLIFIVFYPSYHLGIFLARHPLKIPRIWGGAIFALLLCFSFIEAAFLSYSGSILAATQLKISSLLLSSLILVEIICSNPFPKIGNISLLRSLGMSSYFIYLYHLPILRLFEKVLERVIGYGIPVIALSIICTALLLLGVSLILQRVLGKHRASFYFGA